jgi:hypothetical protein
MFAVLASSNGSAKECILCGRSLGDHELHGVRLLAAQDVQLERLHVWTQQRVT